MSLTGDGYKGPFVTDIIVVKGLRCPAGYVLLANTQSGDRASLTRKSFTKADVFVCVKKETAPKTVIADVCCVDMGKEVLPPGYQLVDSRAGGMRTMIAVKRAPRDSSDVCVGDVCATIPRKEKLAAAWRVSSKSLGDDVHLAYKVERLHGSGNHADPIPAPRPPSRPASAQLYPDTDPNAPNPVLPAWTASTHASNVALSDAAYRALDGVMVEATPPAGAHGNAGPGPAPAACKTRAQIEAQYAHNTGLERRLLGL